jgi:CRP-like cAMP-binding protein
MPPADVPNTPIKPQSFLANLPLFREVAPEELAKIAAGTTEVHAARGEILFHKGDPCVGFHMVVYGHVKLAITSANGDEKVIELIGPGQSFGEALMFMEMPYVVYAQTLADTLLLHISKSVVFEEIERQPRFARRMIAGLSRRLHGLIGDLEAYSLHSGIQRVIGYLLRAEPDGDAGGTTAQLKLPTSKGIIASRLNLTPEHFSRILHELTVAKLIAVDGRNVTILDLDRLRVYEGK